MIRPKQPENRPRKRWIIIGPGIILALILALQIAITGRKSPSGPPIVERQVVDATGAGEAVALAHEPIYALMHGEQLRLTKGQESRLMELQAEWEEESAPLQERMSKAASDFEKYMKGAGDKASMREIQSRAAPVSDLSREMSSLRRTYWEKALQALGPKQKKMLEKDMPSR